MCSARRRTTVLKSDWMMAVTMAALRVGLMAETMAVMMVELLAVTTVETMDL